MHLTLLVPNLGVIQEDSWASKGVVHNLQFRGQVEGNGGGLVPKGWRCSRCTGEIRWKVC